MVRKIRVKAPAKINLFLEVTGKRPDGYHDLATLFAGISLADELTLAKTEKPGIRLKVVNQADLAGLRAEDNIVYKAAAAFFPAFKINPAVEIKLVKKVPAGAGLGGGSSDAAAALKGLCKLYGVDPALNRKKLKAIALSLGSDVPFFLTGDAFSFGTGRGEILKPVKAKGRFPFIVLVYPGVPVATGPVYRALSPSTRREVSSNLKKLRLLIKALEAGRPLKDWGVLLFNRLEEPVLSGHAAVRLAKERLMEAGASAALMSGSGASVFALAETRFAASKILKILKKPGYRVFLLNFC
ncbi:MAG: 4-(cytidine 5'-diphospho)-2-C-methyl-D-erythritol kinase [Elusimicrobia bacterium GWA2_56_46]|nr:MAG: 4-(cytidine 5'-diphospho)-2-C-methyl-D-erythritol kinase [Elusimicrobia bacterium GWA2_56_46]OGR54353.1 MAG: 4-(cytidine 5'-diphospho)-2-C-methyl-D-erythritol kinase [Elusimicrobia bacterium GWC2_56_31]HBB65725.1 4-(cytidine 5'-diphospho)-2-C-methyl-D-erythritol kinase [Elusimicrobiota bacterium]HBW22796.1 4-(cytidine 5'-diphospho)-2-C-methyl-D-erythritol kinase [Elusimicrobiota bacterium]